MSIKVLNLDHLGHCYEDADELQVFMIILRLGMTYSTIWESYKRICVDLTDMAHSKSDYIIDTLN